MGERDCYLCGATDLPGKLGCPECHRETEVARQSTFEALAQALNPPFSVGGTVRPSDPLDEVFADCPDCGDRMSMLIEACGTHRVTTYKCDRCSAPKNPPTYPRSSQSLSAPNKDFKPVGYVCDTIPMAKPGQRVVTEGSIEPDEVISSTDTILKEIINNYKEGFEGAIAEARIPVHHPATYSDVVHPDKRGDTKVDVVGRKTLKLGGE